MATDMGSSAPSPPPPALPSPTSKHHTLHLRLARSNTFRTINVPSNYDFHLLHRLIQFILGWSDTHLHRFEVRNACQSYKASKKRNWIKEWGPTVLRVRGLFQGVEDPFDEKDEMFDNIKTVLETRVTIADVWKVGLDEVPGAGRAVHYLYDFGDA